MKTKSTKNKPAFYEIRVAGHLSENWAVRFEGLSMRHEPDGETVLSGLLDQSALHGVLVKIRDLGLKLISVNCTGTEETSKNKHKIKKGEMKNE
jgi:hypothetical protein